MTQFVQRDLLDLADPFAGKPELAAHLVERALAAVVEAETQPDHGLLPLGQGGEHDLDVVAQQALGDGVLGLVTGIHAGHEIAQRALAILADGLVE